MRCILGVYLIHIKNITGLIFVLLRALIIESFKDLTEIIILR